MIKNDLLLKALRKEDVKRPPVWMMRQAGRYLPQYIELRKKYDFFTRVQTPELACEITLQPVDELGVDAAILFSDILVIPQVMGMEVVMEEGKGPVLPNPIRSEADLTSLRIADAENDLDYVYQAIALIKKELNDTIPLIGFAGAPFTILCYMVEGKGSKGFEKAKAFCFEKQDQARKLLDAITQVTIAYLKKQVAAGADVVQVFDSWSGLLSEEDFNQWSAPYLVRIAEALAPLAPTIVFPKGSWYALPSLSQNPAISAIGIDWTISPQAAREATQGRVALQGNFDPSKLMLPPAAIKKEVIHMIKQFGTKAYVANLGHGILPHIPVDHAKAFVDTVKSFEHVGEGVI